MLFAIECSLLSDCRYYPPGGATSAKVPQSSLRFEPVCLVRSFLQLAGNILLEANWFQGPTGRTLSVLVPGVWEGFPVIAGHTHTWRLTLD